MTDTAKEATGRTGAWWTSSKEKKEATSDSPFRVVKAEPLRVRTAEDEKNCLITGLDITWDGNIVLADRNNSKVKLFSQDGHFISALNMPEKPIDLTVFNASKFAVCMWFQQIGIIKMSDKYQLSLKDIIKLDYNVWAITSFEDNLIITCGTEPRSVKMISTQGEVLWSVETASDGTVLFDCPYFITSSPSAENNMVVVSDEDRLTLTILDGRKGKLLDVYNVENGEPRGVAIDDYDNIYLCYETGEIFVRLKDSDKEICLANRTGGLKQACSMEFNVKESELLLTSSFNNPDIINFVHRYKLT